MPWAASTSSGRSIGAQLLHLGELGVDFLEVLAQQGQHFALGARAAGIAEVQLYHAAYFVERQPEPFELLDLA